MTDREILIIKTVDDINKHFLWHDKQLEESRQRLYKATGAEWDKLLEESEYLEYGCGWWGIFCKKIEMYAGDEGDVLSNVHYCPFCGIRFVFDGVKS